MFIQSSKEEGYSDKYFSHFSRKTYVVGTHWKCIINMFSWRGKENINTVWLKEVSYLELCVINIYYIFSSDLLRFLSEL